MEYKRSKDPAKEVNFLDLTISINPDGSFSSRIYQEPMSLFLYIPGHSAHPPGILKSMVYGLMKTYLQQNTHRKDAMHAIRLLFNRLLARGHSHENLRLVFNDAAAKLTKVISNKKVNEIRKAKSQLSSKKVFFHLPLHPHDISRKEIQRIYSDTCESTHASFHEIYNSANKATMKVPGIVIAYSRPKNIRDVLTPSTLFESELIAVDRFANDLHF